MSRARLGFLVGVTSAVLVLIGLSCKQETAVDVFPGMDGVTLQPTGDKDDPLRGRIVWNLWIGDSWKMWDYLAQHGFGTADLIKTVDSRRHNTRFAEVGIINQPGFM